MRTKTLFIAAAALAVGLATSLAQSNVYSVNIVGWITVPLTTQKALLENPLDNGTNDITSIDAGAIPNKSAVSTWNGTGFNTSTKSGGVWTPDLAIAPGVGFFVTPKSACTVTFIGSAPTSNNYVLGTVKSMVGAIIPTAGFLNDAGSNCLNLGSTVGFQIPNKSAISTWNGTGYSTSTKSGGAWSPNLSVGVASGFFVTPKAACTWSQWLQ